MDYALYLLGATIVSVIFFWSSLKRYWRLKIDERKDTSRVQELSILKSQHETASSLWELFDKDGAGAWPPKANHDSWPTALRPYKDIYLALSPILPAAEASLDDTVNNERRSTYRSLMRKLLAERINIAQVEEIMAAVEAGNWDVLSRDAYNGFYGCIAVCRHAYRWATIPVVKVAQVETVVDFPPELNVPWPFLQRNFGVTAESGNNTANVLHNFNEKGQRVYKINAFPIYYEMVGAVICFEKNDKVSCENHMKNIAFRLRHLLKVFYENLIEARVSHSVWLSYIQGFQGWGVGRIVDGKFIKYDGLSGNHVLFFQALDAFLGMDPYLTEENLIRYIPINQRKLCAAFRKHSFRNKLDDHTGSKIEGEIKHIVQHLKTYRAAHRTRVMPYLEQPAPERLVMTAGKSVLEDSTTTGKDMKDILKNLDEMLLNRLKQTV